MRNKIKAQQYLYILLGFFYFAMQTKPFPMWYYVYILELNNGKHYVGCTVNLKERYARHKKGYVPATKPHLPLKLVWCCSFPDRYKAYDFEQYLKSGSGRAFASKHLFYHTRLVTSQMKSKIKLNP